MGQSLPPLLPPQASTVAVEVDALYALLVSITAFFTILVVGLFLYFGLKYRRKSESERPIQVHPPAWLEIAWSVVPLLICVVLFTWGVRLYFTIYTPPKDAITVHVVGKRWMWKIQHMSGAREINELHVPVNTPVRMLITSEDVIHAFSLPAFRVKRDAIPGTMTDTWFNATKVGEYHIFCAEYCGTKHSGMIGTVYVMEKDAYQKWLAGPNAGLPPAVQGEKLFTELNCISCHRNGPTQRGTWPTLRQPWRAYQAAVSSDSVSSTASVRFASRSARSSPTQKITCNPAARAAFANGWPRMPFSQCSISPGSCKSCPNTSGIM